MNENKQLALAQTYQMRADALQSMLVQAACSETLGPLIVKLTPTQPLERITTLLSDIPQAYAINSVHWSAAYPPEQRSPLAHLGGGAVSGGTAQQWTWEAVRRLTASSDIPVIGPSVWEYDDIARLRKLGAKAISFGSVFIRRPWAPTNWVQRDMAESEGDDA